MKERNLICTRELIRSMFSNNETLTIEPKSVTLTSADELFVQKVLAGIPTFRLKRAAQLSEQNQLTIAEIAHEVGFNDLQYFREWFKKLFGVTPYEYTQESVKDPIAD